MTTAEERVPRNTAGGDYSDDPEVNGINLSNRVYETNPPFRDSPPANNPDIEPIQTAILAIVIELRRQNETLERIAVNLDAVRDELQAARVGC